MFGEGRWRGPEVPGEPVAHRPVLSEHGDGAVRVLGGQKGGGDTAVGVRLGAWHREAERLRRQAACSYERKRGRAASFSGW